ncbi:hypothetical protein [Photobacterium alginatilyticum]|uniref:DUF4440 domain-containing protein n=1 Tax=Photobacterium alginatilyticum TaxID=1775171 RepID=A0ABW9YN40_9GAMM|nr:hypothetical protein [Photobacterium alginatilyticum]NBI54790.1 hypothetical protein [Photobacterium alginatilyticum]
MLRKIILYLILLFPWFVYGDALIRSQAMKASTIAEFYIEEKGVRVELEIGSNALPAFRNLLPDPVYQYLGFGQRSFSKRLSHFFSEDLVLFDNQKPLTASLVAITPAKRVIRDEITGEPLPIPEDDLEDVVKATLHYRFESQPKELVFQAPHKYGLADIGFVAYHKGIAVNDFRYLSSGYILSLDWQDPWYSTFNTRNLRRQYFAPMSGFIYVEPLEVRKEIIVRPKDLQRWLDLGLEGKSTIPIAMQGDLKLKVADFLSRHQPVTINGKAVTGQLDSVNFLERTLTSSRVIDPPQELDLDGAILGAIFVYPQAELPGEVVMNWDLWDDRIKLVPASAVDEAGPLPTYLQPEWQKLVWTNYLKNPTIPALKVITPPPAAWQQWLHDARWLLYLICLLMLLIMIKSARQPQGRRAVMLVALFVAVAAGVTSSLGKASLPSEQRGEEIIDGLLHNIYRAFDYREEGAIYDTLSSSVTGDLLTDIYLETRRGLELVNQGGARAKVKAVEVQSVVLSEAAQGEGFQADVSWIVKGSVGHWGHVHQRNNRYQAKLMIEPIAEQWKLTSMTVLHEERL